MKGRPSREYSVIRQSLEVIVTSVLALQGLATRMFHFSMTASVFILLTDIHSYYWPIFIPNDFLRKRRFANNPRGQIQLHDRYPGQCRCERRRTKTDCPKGISCPDLVGLGRTWRHPIGGDLRRVLRKRCVKLDQYRRTIVARRTQAKTLCLAPAWLHNWT